MRTDRAPGTEGRSGELRCWTGRSHRGVRQAGDTGWGPDVRQPPHPPVRPLSLTQPLRPPRPQDRGHLRASVAPSGDRGCVSATGPHRPHLCLLATI